MRHMSIFRLLPVLLLCALMCSAAAPIVRAQDVDRPTLQAEPAAPGGALAVQGYGFPADTSIELRLASPALILGSVLSNGRGAFRSDRLSVSGRLSPGEYALEAYGGRDTTTPLARTTLTIQAAPTITLSPASGPPGTIVQVSAANLSGTAMQVRFGEAVLIGPQRLRGDSYNGMLVVPRNAAAGSSPVHLMLFSGDRVLGTVEAAFQTTAAPAPYRLVDLRVEDENLRPGSTFTIRGRIDPAPRDALSDFSINALWESAATQVSMPVGSNPALIASDGSFQMLARVPHLWDGDPISPAPEDRLKLTLVQTGEAVAEERLEAGFASFQPYFSFAFRVLRPDGSDVPNPPPANPNEPRPLYTRLEPLIATEMTYSELLKGVSSAETLNAAGLLFALNLKELLYYPVECAEQVLSYNAEAEFKYWEWAVNPWESARYIPQSGVPALPPIIKIAPGSARSTISQLDESPEPVTIFRLYVDASRVIDPPQGPNGYGLTKTVNGETYAQAYDRLFLHLPARNETYLIDEDGLATLQPSPVPIQLEALPENVLGSIHITSFTAMNRTPLSTTKLNDGSTQHYLGSIYTLAGETLPTTGGSMPIELEVELVKGTVDELNLGAVSVLFNNNPVALAATSDGGCGNPLTWARFTGSVPGASHLPVGFHKLEAFVTGAGSLSKQSLLMAFGNLPKNAWIYQPVFNSTTRSIAWNTGGLTLFAQAFDANTTKLDLNTNVPHVGTVANDTSVGGTMNEFVAHGSLSVGPYGSGGMNSQAVDNPAAPVGFGNDAGPTVQPQNAVAAPLPTLQVDGDACKTTPNCLTILDTGKIRVFEVQYGIPAIAYVYIGIDLRIYATTTLNATLDLDPRVINDFEAGVDVSIEAGAELLAGIADASFSFESRFATNLYSSHTPTQPLTVDGECFRARLTIYWTIELLWGLFSVASGNEEIFNETAGSLCPPDGPIIPPFNTIQSTQTTSRSPFTANPSVATDGLGNTMAVWRSNDGAIVASRHSGGRWLPPAVINLGDDAGSPAIAFYAPNRAVAVWSQSSLPDDYNPLPSDPIARARFILARQHLVYARFNGVNWSTPANLTAPNTGGDGRVALAACPAADPACPEGGAVTAVWVHDAAGDIGERRFRIQHATFAVNPNSGLLAWQPTATLDANDAVSDTEPDVTYLNGTPVVVWVRDLVRKVDPAPLLNADRRLAVRFLDGSSPLVLPNAPAGVGEPAILADSQGNLQLAFTIADDADGIVSNRRALHRALGTCGGAGSCSWDATKLLDAKGRTIFAESPDLTQSGADQISLLFRALGYDPVTAPLTPLAGIIDSEAPGILLGTGEIGKLITGLDLNAQVGLVDYLTWDPATNAKPTMVFDPVLNSDIVLAVKGVAPQLNGRLAAILNQSVEANRDRSAPLTSGDPIIGISDTAQPNFVVREVGPITQNGDGSVQVDVEVANVGAPWAGGEALRVAATWDGVDRETAGEASLTSLGAGQVSTLTIMLQPPPNRSRTHTLWLELNPGRLITEQTAADNDGSTVWRALAAPSTLNAVPVTEIAGLVSLRWPVSSDERVIGYRIYRINNGKATPVGVSYTGSWAESGLAPGTTASYAVAALAADYSESPLSPTASVIAGDGMPGEVIYLPLLSQ